MPDLVPAKSLPSVISEHSRLKRAYCATERRCTEIESQISNARSHAELLALNLELMHASTEFCKADDELNEFNARIQLLRVTP